MSKNPGMMESEDAKVETTLDRRVSDMLKDGNSGPPMLFRHTSMQKIRHCCQNLNLFPYLLYSFDNSKSHPIARQVHLRLGLFVKEVTARVLFLYNSLRQTVLRGIRTESPRAQLTGDEEVEQPQANSLDKPQPRFRMLERQKRKQIPFFLTLAVYLTPLLLACQCIGLCSLMIFGKYTPGFIFLTTALLFLGCISLKIMFHETMVHTFKCEKSKVQ